MECPVRGLLVTFVFLMVPPVFASEPLSEYRWEHRIIVASIASGKEAKGVQQSLEQSGEGVRDRDLIVIDVSKTRQVDGAVRLSASDAAEVRRQLAISAKGSQFVLIGKDGGEKARQKGKLSLGKFFGLIDTMPMRRAEIRRKQG